MPIVFACPTCTKRVKVSRRFAGQEGACPGCGAPLRVPTLQEAAEVHEVSDEVYPLPGAAGPGVGEPAGVPPPRSPVTLAPPSLAPGAAAGEAPGSSPPDPGSLGRTASRGGSAGPSEQGQAPNEQGHGSGEQGHGSGEQGHGSSERIHGSSGRSGKPTSGRSGKPTSGRSGKPTSGRSGKPTSGRSGKPTSDRTRFPSGRREQQGAEGSRRLRATLLTVGAVGAVGVAVAVMIWAARAPVPTGSSVALSPSGTPGRVTTPPRPSSSAPTPGSTGEGDRLTRRALTVLSRAIEALPDDPPRERPARVRALRALIRRLRRRHLAPDLAQEVEEASTDLETQVLALSTQATGGDAATAPDGPPPGPDASAAHGSTGPDGGDSSDSDDPTLDAWIARVGGWKAKGSDRPARSSGEPSTPSAPARSVPTPPPAGPPPATPTPATPTPAAPTPATPRPAGPSGVAPQPAANAPAAQVKARSLAAGNLLDRACTDYDGGAASKLQADLDAIERLGYDLPETQAALGLQWFSCEAFSQARQAFAEAGAVGGVDVARAHTRAAFFTKHYAEARAAARALPADDRAAWDLLIDGPFRHLFPLAAPVAELESPSARYRVVTDLGLASNALTLLEKKLEKTPPARRKRLLAAARRSHRGLHEHAQTMDAAYRAYSKLLRGTKPPQVYPTVYVLSSRTDFDGFSQALHMGQTENILGYYAPYYRVLVFYDQKGPCRSGRVLSEATEHLLLHETFHQWLDLYVHDAPDWFNEGLAEYFGIGKITARGLRYGLLPTQHPSRLDTIRDALATSSGYGSIHPLSALLRFDHQEFMSDAGVDYAEAWSFVHYLGSTPAGQRRLREYFDALRAGLDRDKAYWKVFGPVNMQVVEQDWKAYVRGLH